MEKCSDSERLASLRLPLIIAVVFIHVYGGSYSNSNLDPTINSLYALTLYAHVTEFISQCLSRVAVPLFFVISGFFLFIKFNLSFSAYRSLLYSRFHSLFFPYLFWNALILFFYWFFQSYTPFGGLFSSGKIISHYTFFEYVESFLGLSGYPIAYQFWFIRDLIILVVLSPLIYFAIKSSFILIIFLLIFLIWFLNSAFVIPLVESLLFFIIGGFFAFRYKTLFIYDRYVSFFGIFCLFFASIYLFAEQNVKFFIVKAYIMFGVFFILGVTQYLMYASRLKSFLVWVSGSSFFVFATHEPLLTFVKKLSVSFLSRPASTEVYLYLYFLVPVILVFFLCTFYFVIKKIFPKTMSVICGR